MQMKANINFENPTQNSDPFFFFLSTARTLQLHLIVIPYLLVVIIFAEYSRLLPTAAALNTIKQLSFRENPNTGGAKHGWLFLIEFQL